MKKYKSNKKEKYEKDNGPPTQWAKPFLARLLPEMWTNCKAENFSRDNFVRLADNFERLLTKWKLVHFQKYLQNRTVGSMGHVA